MNTLNWRRNDEINSINKFTKIIAYKNFDYFIIYDDYYTEFSLDLLFIAYFKPINKGNNFNFDKFLHFPILCAERYSTSNPEQNLYKNLVDVYSDLNEFGISFYFIFRNIDNLVIFYLDEIKINSTINNFDESGNFYCEDTIRRYKGFGSDGRLCIPLRNDIPKCDILLKFNNKKFERILVKTIIDLQRMKKTSIIFLLDNSYRLHVYNRIIEFDFKSVDESIEIEYKQETICFEGTYLLINRKVDQILDIYLDDEQNAILILTKQYLQRIPIQTFCSKTSYSSCLDNSTCNIGSKVSPICKDPKFKDRNCFSKLNKLQKMKSDLFLCDKESKDMCIVADTTNLTTKLKNNLLICKEESCLCESQYCFENNCNFDSIEKKLCPLPKSSMELSKFSISYQLEPFYIIIFSKFVTLLVIAFTLISFYCCFSISQSKKALTDLAMISDLQSN